MSPASEPQELSGRLIMLVDDVPENLLLLEEVLRAEGYRVRTVTDGGQVLDAALEELPDLILLDIVMPGFDGYEVCRQLKRTAATRAIPVLFISALDDTHAIVKAFRAGGVDYIGKPIRAAEVLARVRTQLSLLASLEAQRQTNLRLQTALEELEALRGLAIAHELRNPIASLKGHAQLLQESLVEGTREWDKADRVVREAVRLERFTTGLLDFVRCGQLQRSPSGPGVLLRAAADELDTDRVSLRIQEGIPPWPLDPVRMQQALKNLLENGLQAGEAEAGVQATVDCSDEALTFTIADDGPGIDERDLERIFEPFYSRSAHGTGLGLTITKRIVTAHGGSIEVESGLYGGTRFVIRIPAAPDV